MTKIHLPLNDRSYDVLIERDLLARAGDVIHQLGLRGKVCVMTSPTVKANYLSSLLPGLENNKFDVHVYTLPSGEETKSLEQAEKIYSQLLDWHFERGSSIIALGGGVVGDLAGFVASTFLRGIPYVQIPTTLLSQVDSAIGGKVAVNHPLGKNLIGAIYQPKVVLVDPELLLTLHPREMLSGFGETLKFSLIRDIAFFKEIVHERKAILDSRDPHILKNVITESIRIKANYIAEDEFDSGLQRILNFGHTIGHAIEAVAGYHKIRHGEAVIKGVRAAVEISEEIRLLASGISNRILEFIDQLPVPAVRLNIEEVMQRMSVDKKVTNGKLTFVLLKNIGEPIIVTNGLSEYSIHEDQMREALLHVCS